MRKRDLPLCAHGILIAGVALLVTMTPRAAQAQITYGGYRYSYTSTTMSWTAAEAEAVARGGHLASIHSEAENEFIRNNFTGGVGFSWIGLTDEQAEGMFVWSDGSPVDYTRWAATEPNNAFGNESYAAIYNTREWNDLGPSFQLRGVIKVPVVVPEPGTIPLMVGGTTVLGMALVKRRKKRSE